VAFLDIGPATGKKEGVSIKRGRVGDGGGEIVIIHLGGVIGKGNSGTLRQEGGKLHPVVVEGLAYQGGVFKERVRHGGEGWRV
jgi:hypothetical protein